MERIESYLRIIAENAKVHLDKEYKLNNFSPTQLELINFYLLDKAITTETNLFIKSTINQNNSEIFLPTFLSIAISLFFKNYCDDITEYKNGDILQKNKKRYQYVKENANGTHHIRSTDGDYPEVSSKNLKKYTKINAHLSSRTVRTGLSDYKKFFNQIFPSIGEQLPSEFKYKAAFVLDKKQFLNEIKEQTFTSINLLKAVPFQWVNKNGKFETPQIPVDPMIYLAPDYETIKEYIFDSDTDVETVILIGKNKYCDEAFLKLKRDLRNEKIPFAIISGQEDIIDDSEQFCKWKWTPEELSILKVSSLAEIATVIIEQSTFTEQIQSIESQLNQLRQKYSIELPNFSGIKKLLFALTLPSTSGRMNNQIEYIKYLINKEFTEEIKSELFNQNITPTGILLDIENQVSQLFQLFENEKLKKVSKINFDYLIIPDRFEDVWQEETQYKVLGFKAFRKKLREFTIPKSFLFNSVFGYGVSANELLEICRNTQHQYKILCYPEEIQVVETLNNRHKQEVSKELSSIDRKKLCSVKFTISQTNPEPENITDLIGRIDAKNSSNKTYNYDSSESINYKIDYDSGESIVLNGSKSVLLDNNNQKRRVRICNLKSKDQIRVYSNTSKEILFETATKQDNNGRLSEIESHSKLWKQCLSDYYQTKGFGFSEEDLLQALKNVGSTVTSVITLKNWLNKDSSVKFPQKKKDLKAIASCLNNSVLNSHLSSIIKSKETYSGLMIALGRDLSDEIMDYILYNKKGQILTSFSDAEIATITDNSAPLRTINNISITEEDESE